MILGVALTALVVKDYDAAIEFYRDRLGFVLTEDTQLSESKRWVRLRAPGKSGSEILLSKAENEAQFARIGDQTGGRVLLFLHTDDLRADYKLFSERGVEFTEHPVAHSYGKVAVFKDLYGNRIDLIEPGGRS